MSNISLIGGGPLALAIGTRLCRSGMNLGCWNRTPAKLASLQRLGGNVAVTKAELFPHSRLLLICVSDASAVREIFLTPSIPEPAAPALRIVNLSTIGDQASGALERELSAAGFAYTDMPVSGGVEGALAGKLAAYVGRAPLGDPLFSQVLNHLVSAPVYLADNQMAQAMKVLNNLCEAINLWGAAEAVAIGQRFGFSIPELQRGLTCGRGDSAYLKLLLGRLAKPDEQVAVSLSTRQKDLHLALDLAARLEADAPVLATVSHLFGQVSHACGANRDQISCHRWLQEGAGETPAAPLRA